MASSRRASCVPVILDRKSQESAGAFVAIPAELDEALKSDRDSSRVNYQSAVIFAGPVL
jgi:hypothetical protein